ncbi:TPA: DUF551 domain-containing protein [Enterobacter cloacae]|uniref:DUF551 domain-containing protein n=1 Tax=Enterobacter TaxID=547 RepID=UPI00079B0772|nr:MULTISPECIES: DUF551 domain-containing protein [Enterobacter]HAS0832079.1 DUF551 domain-containing protein [Enterobacter cloacae subsp. cloacae]NWJ82531.1 DUF551 domain-containing protein [Enterobacter sp. SECR19-1250]QUG51559.1 DUF551 domain-containing protein [Enterobacter cloacae]SAE09971.1 Protein of uncharacterised function (DUF551) [Enterobacter roggenkampii]HDS4823273.1 DUF551 domain-containing protein [Enterobacter cloacae]
MSTITRELAKLFRKITNSEIDADGNAHVVLSPADSLLINNARIALASLEAEPVGEVSEQRDGLVMDGTVDLGGASTHRIIKGASKMKRLPLGTKFYTAPPAPVSVPDAMEMDDDFDSAFEHGKAVGWNACRAAILQGAEPVQGWIPCSDRMPTKNDRVLIFINFNSDTVPPSIHDAQFTGSTFRRGNATVNVFPLEDGYGVTHWMPLPAAPQQEVK